MVNHYIKSIDGCRRLFLNGAMSRKIHCLANHRWVASTEDDIRLVSHLPSVEQERMVLCLEMVCYSKYPCHTLRATHLYRGNQIEFQRVA